MQVWSAPDALGEQCWNLPPCTPFLDIILTGFFFAPCHNDDTLSVEGGDNLVPVGDLLHARVVRLLRTLEELVLYSVGGRAALVGADLLRETDSSRVNWKKIFNYRQLRRNGSGSLYEVSSQLEIPASHEHNASAKNRPYPEPERTMSIQNT